MPSTRPESSLQRRQEGARLPLSGLVGCLVGCLVGGLVGCLTLSGCALVPTEDAEPAGATTAGAGVDAGPRMGRVLRARQRAVLDADQEAWLATVSRGSPARTAQLSRFDNLVQLPLARLRHQVVPTTVVQSRRGWRAVVETTMRLEGYDAAPVTRRSRFHFVPAPRGRGLLVASDRDRAWERRNDVELQPWDVGPVHVERSGRVLGIFDDGSVDRSAEVLAAVAAGIDAVSAQVPHPWSRSVVVYALSDTGMLEGLDGLPNADPDRLDAIAFAVSTTEGGSRLAGMRFVLHPRMLQADAERLARLIRHELTHVALGRRDDEVPLWLSEGVAEWVSVQPLPQARRLVPGAALEAARKAPTRLPPDATFNADGSGGDYGLAWWACEAIVDIRGAEALWQLLDELAASPPQRSDALLRRHLGLSERQLADEAARRLVASYG